MIHFVRAGVFAGGLRCSAVNTPMRLLHHTRFLRILRTAAGRRCVASYLGDIWNGALLRKSADIV